jgi:ribosomal protein L37AE/L43A
MTPAERALLLAVAKQVEAAVLGGFPLPRPSSGISPLIAAVEEEAAPKPKPDVCPTCNGRGEHHSGNGLWSCTDCDGSGKKDTPHD